jgi:hypothetical protein
MWGLRRLRLNSFRSCGKPLPARYDAALDSTRFLPPKMDLHTDIELRGNVLLVTASGSVELHAALRLLKEACDTAKHKGVSKILVNTLGVDGGFPPLRDIKSEWKWRHILSSVW